jgi:hypothetical protein
LFNFGEADHRASGMTAQPRAANEDYTDVELAANPNVGSYFFIEGTSTWSFVTTIVGLAAFLIMHAYAALRSPPSLASKSEFYGMNETSGNVTVDIDITLSQLQDGHRFVTINASLISVLTDMARVQSVDFTTRNTFLKGTAIVRNDNPPKETFPVTFSAGSGKSALFPVAHFRIDGYDAIQLRITLQSSFHGIIGSEFVWHFANPSADKYARSTRLLLSFLMGYMLALFAFYLRFDSESFTQVFLLVVGITGVFASNPVTYFFPAIPGGKVSDHILLALFLATYKMFLVLELEMLRSHSPKPATVYIAVIGVAFAFYATADSAASYDRQAHLEGAETETAVVLQTEALVAMMHCVYSVIVLTYAVTAFVLNDGLNPRRVAYFGASAVVTVIVLLFTRVLCVYANFWLYSVKPPLLEQATTATFAAMSLFLMHTGGGPEYVGLDKVKETDQQVIEIDQISGDAVVVGKGADDEEEDDNEEEEEEE